MKPYYSDDSVTLYHGDCIEVMRELPDASVDAVVTDPPYELGFMGKGWDASGIAYNLDVWTQALRVLKPGGFLLAFGGTRTWHRLACAIEDAGFEVRDSIAWMYGSGFPKSLDVGRAIEGKLLHGGSAPSNIRKVNMGANYRPHRAAGRAGFADEGLFQKDSDDRNPPGELTTPAAQQWQGWGTALKPAFEPIVVARKPLIGTVAENVLRHGTGALNIDGCRIGTEGERPTGLKKNGARSQKASEGWDRPWKNDERAERVVGDGERTTSAGRWPANVILDESQAAELDRQSGDVRGFSTQRDNGHESRSIFGGIGSIPQGQRQGFDDQGGASRFFYTAKANSAERPRVDGVAHPTVKPLDLMQYLCRLVTPPGGVILEPFAGSGTTLEAAVIEGFRVIGIELTEDYLPLILQRLTKPIEVTLL